MEPFSAYNLIIASSAILIVSHFFGEISKKTNVPSVLMLIALGIGLKLAMDASGLQEYNFFPLLEILGIVGLIMIVLEAALELELKREKYLSIAKAFGIALVGLLLSAWVAAALLKFFIPEMSNLQAWLYATPLSILSSAIIIPSVSSLSLDKKEFHVYESTFSDILGIMLFYFLTEQITTGGSGESETTGLAGFMLNTVLTIGISLIASYLILIIFQRIKSHVKLFLLIAVLLLLYALGKKMHLSSLIIILIFGLLIANMKLFFSGPLEKYLHLSKAKDIYERLHVITIETAFVVRTFFFVIFGMTISLAYLAHWEVVLISGLIVLSIYCIRYVLLRFSIGSDIVPQLFIAPRGLITILLFYAIPKEAQLESFNNGILLFVIISTGIIMTAAMIYDRRRGNKAIARAQSNPVATTRWKAPSVDYKES